MTDKNSSRLAREVVKLTDLAPRQDVKGGSQRRVFGPDPIEPPHQTRRSSMKSAKPSATKQKDLPPKSSGSVKGGMNYTGNENITLLRAAKPASPKKDLPAGKDVKGGKKKS